MTGFVIEVRLEDMDAQIDSTVRYGPFQVRRSAVDIARRIGKQAGLNLNTWGDWCGTDGGGLIASVQIRPVLSQADWPGAAADIRTFFMRER